MQNAEMARREPKGATWSHENVLKRKVGCDVTFEVGPAKEIIFCHKIFLIARSSVFEDMFKDEATTAEGPIKLLEVEPRIFQSFLTFIYTDLIDSADQSCLKQLLYLAEKYHVYKLQDQCDEMLLMMPKPNNIIYIHSIARKYSLTQCLAKYEMTDEGTKSYKLQLMKAKRIALESPQGTQPTRDQRAAASHLNVLKRKVGCDVSFEVGQAKEIISCHKIFLIARSTVFEVMFEDRWTNHGNKGDEKIIKLPDVDSWSFGSFLKFLYADLIKPADMSCPNIEKLLYLAEKYDVLELKNRCEEILMAILALNNVLHIHSIAEQFSLVRLLTTAQHRINSEFSRLILDPSFFTLDVSLLTRFVASDDIHMDELDLFNALMNWSESQCKKLKLEPSGENLRTVLGPILPHVRFPIMGSSDFGNFVVPRNILKDQEKLAIFEYICSGSGRRYNFDVSRLDFKVHARKGSSKQN